MKFLNLLTLLLLLHALSATSQPALRLSVKNTTIAATDSLMPLWFTASRDGKVRPAGSWLNLTDLYVGQSYGSAGPAFSYTWGANAVVGLGESNYNQLNRAYGGISWKGWELKAGMFYDPMQYAGLSTTNGNLARSRNARPYPKIRFATRGYKPVPFLQNRLQFRAEYDEGILNDQRFVDNTRLHHKSFYLRIPVSATWALEGGLEHFVMWGGTSPVESIGKLPYGFNAYLKYITGASGDESFPETDQINVAGNHLGTYQFKVTKRFPEMDVEFYLNHPFEDLSGMNWRNWPDNLLGLHIRFNNRQQFITDVVYEYTNTRQQSIRGPQDNQEPDSYFNHGIYRSGYTYHQQMMGSPLFFPAIVTEGISRGLRSNMLLSHHLGMQGQLRKHLHWKSLLTWIQHEGRYFNRYQPVHKQVSGQIEVQYSNPALPVDLGLATAADATNTSGRNVGVWFTVSWEVGETK